MIIQQAIYGVSTGHALLRWSDETLVKQFNDAAWLTDLPATCPFGVTWAPFFRMVWLDGWMFFVHTRPDPGAERGGMVCSRAALIPLVEVASLNDLSEIAEELRRPLAPTDPVLPISLTKQSKNDDPRQVSEFTTAITQALMREVTRPAVVIQQDRLDDALFELWQRAPPEFRSKLTFGLSFSPEDVHEMAIICTPKELASRWDPAQTVSPEGEATVNGHVATVLNLQVSNSVREFANRVTLPLDSVRAIAIAIQAAELWRAESTSAGDVQLLRILAERALPSTGASDARALIGKRLTAATATWTPSVVLSLRNLDIASLEVAGGLAKAIHQWVKDRSLSVVHVGLLEILTAWLSEKPTHAWRDSVEAGLRAALTETDVPESLFALVWAAITAEPVRSQQALSLLEGPQHEKLLTACVDGDLSQEVANVILPTALSKEWWLLAGNLLSRSRSTSAALKAAISAAPSAKSARKTLIASSLSQANAAELTDAAIESHDAVATQLAAHACVKTTSILSRFDWKRYEWFQLFKAAYDISPNVIEALPDRIVGMGQMIAAQMAVRAIWQVVAHTPLADLADVPDRCRAWNLIPGDLADGILDVTSHSWLRQFERGKRFSTELEPRLATAVSAIAKRPDYLMEALRREPASLTLYLADFPFETDCDAFQFLTQLKDSNLRLAEASSKALGRTLVAGGWARTARDAVEWLHFRHDFHPMYRECNSLLAPLDRLWVTFKLGLTSPLTADEAWEAFATEAAHLYPIGPWHNQIWSRSGGNNEDLMQEVSGKASWHRCMRELCNGMHPGAEDLLDEMMDDFPNNNALRQLKHQRFWR